jgi:hypothetical protein
LNGKKAASTVSYLSVTSWSDFPSPVEQSPFVWAVDLSIAIDYIQIYGAVAVLAVILGAIEAVTGALTWDAAEARPTMTGLKLGSMSFLRIGSRWIVLILLIQS